MYIMHILELSYYVLRRATLTCTLIIMHLKALKLYQSPDPLGKKDNKVKCQTIHSILYKNMSTKEQNVSLNVHFVLHALYV